MANSSIGPGFLTQTSTFTEQLKTSFGFVILVSVLLDIGAQLNTWRVLTISELRAQDLSNKLLPGLGFFLSALVIIGGFAFNIGNIAGCGLGVNVLTGLSFEKGAAISCIIALVLFWIRETGKMLDTLTPFLGTGKNFINTHYCFCGSPSPYSIRAPHVHPRKNQCSCNPYHCWRNSWWLHYIFGRAPFVGCRHKRKGKHSSNQQKCCQRNFNFNPDALHFIPGCCWSGNAGNTIG